MANEAKTRATAMMGRAQKAREVMIDGNILGRLSETVCRTCA